MTESEIIDFLISHEVIKGSINCPSCGSSSSTYSFCREVFIFDAQRTSAKLGGPGKTVEVDEAKFCRRKYNRGRFIEGQWVFGGVERGSGKCFLIPVERRDSATPVSYTHLDVYKRQPIGV